MLSNTELQKALPIKKRVLERSNHSAISAQRKACFFPVNLFLSMTYTHLNRVCRHIEDISQRAPWSNE